jgi:hypothetical protein
MELVLFNNDLLKEIFKYFSSPLVLINVCKFWKRQIYETDLILVFANIKYWFDIHPRLQVEKLIQIINLDHLMHLKSNLISYNWRFYTFRLYLKKISIIYLHEIYNPNTLTNLIHLASFLILPKIANIFKKYRKFIDFNSLYEEISQKNKKIGDRIYIKTINLITKIKLDKPKVTFSFSGTKLKISSIFIKGKSSHVSRQKISEIEDYIKEKCSKQDEDMILFIFRSILKNTKTTLE